MKNECDESKQEKVAKFRVSNFTFYLPHFASCAVINIDYSVTGVFLKSLIRFTEKYCNVVIQTAEYTTNRV